MSDKRTFKFVYPVLDHTVTDGDTLSVTIDRGFNDFSHRHVRLFGVDAPELKIAAQHEAAWAVQTVVQAWLAGGPHESLRITSECLDEKFGRVLGDFFFAEDQKKLLTDYLLAWNLVHAYDGQGPRPPWPKEELEHILVTVKEHALARTVIYPGGKK